MKETWHRRPGDRVIRRPPFRPYQLRRVLGVPALFSIGYGDVGSSIYYALGLTAMAALGATPIALAVAGIFFVCTALTYAEGTAALSEGGGSANFARHAFNELLGFVSGWALMLGYMVTISISAFTIPYYLGYFYEPLKTSPTVGTLVSIGLVGFLMAINVLGVKETARLNISISAVDILTQIVLVVLGLVFLFTPERLAHSVTDFWPDFSGLAYGVSIAMISYTGLESVSQVSEETRVPEKRVPIAMMLIAATVILLYAGISITALSAMTPDELVREWASDPVAGIAHAMPFPWLRSLLAPIVAILAGTILLTASNAGLMGASRLSFYMASHRQLPGLFRWVHPRFKTPTVAIIVFFVIAALILLPGLTGGSIFKYMGALYSFGAMLAFSFAHASILALRVRKPDLARPFKLPLGIPIKGYRLPLTAILGLMATLSTWLVVVAMEPYARWVGFGWLAAGLVVYIYYRRQSRLPLLHPAPPRPRPYLSRPSTNPEDKGVL